MNKYKFKFNKFYINHIIKNPLVFYGVLLLGVALFAYLTFTTMVDTKEGEITLFRLIFVKAGKG